MTDDEGVYKLPNLVLRSVLLLSFPGLRPEHMRPHISDEYL